MPTSTRQQDLASSRIATQFSESAKLKSLIASIAVQGDELEDAFASCIDGRALDTAVGTNLDIIGEIVGMSRKALDIGGDFQYFGFSDDTAAAGFGEAELPDVGGVWYDGDPAYGLSFRIMSDEEYRRLIRAQILKNKSIGTVAEINECAELILGLENPYFQPWSAATTYAAGEHVTHNIAPISRYYTSKVGGNLNNAPTGSISDPFWTVSNSVNQAETWDIPKFRDWNSSTAYRVGESVWSSGKEYQALLASTNQDPATQPTYWLAVRVWDSGTAYTPINYVREGGVYYWCTNYHTNKPPASNPLYWTAVSGYDILVYSLAYLSPGRLFYLSSNSAMPIPAGTSTLYLGAP